MKNTRKVKEHLVVFLMMIVLIKGVLIEGNIREAHVKRYLIFFDYVLILKFKKITFDTHTLQACSSKRNKEAKLKRNQRSLEFCRMINNVGILF